MPVVLAIAHVAPYAAVLALLYVFLSIRVVRQRAALRIPLGDGGSDKLLRIQRVHANFAEYVPFALLLMVLDACLGAPPWMMDILGTMLVIGRVAHAYSLSVNEPETGSFRYRMIGTPLTFFVIALAACFLVEAWVRFQFI